jgi:hypothetical protein
VQVDKLSAVCSSCCGEAPFTFRTVASTAIELIGGAESYVPLCRACFSSATVAQEAARDSAAQAGAEVEVAGRPPLLSPKPKGKAMTGADDGADGARAAAPGGGSPVSSRPEGEVGGGR